jgi:hypothetical protein
MTRAYALVLALAILAVAGLYLRHMIKRHQVGPLIWRWFSGHSLDGHHRTNASWTRKATKVLHPSGNAVRWHHLPRYQRAAVRTGTTISIVALWWGLRNAYLPTIAVAFGIIAAAVVVLGFAAVRHGFKLRHDYVWVRPLHRSLTHELGVPPHKVEVARDRSEVTVGLPEHFAGDDRGKQAVTTIVTSKLAIEAPDAEWKLSGKRPLVVYTKSQPPPGRVGWAELLPTVQAADPTDVMLGKGKKNALVSVSIDGDSPHIGLSMGSGDGKSTVARLIAVQFLYHGGLVLFLDYKLISHMWARGLPNVAYAGRPEEIHAALLWLQDEIMRRNDVALAGANIRGEVVADVGPRILVVAEELNATQNRLAAYWRRTKEKGDPGRSPSSEALDEAMFIGRQVKVNILQIGQRLSAKAAGSGDARENLGVKVMSNPSAATWKMLVGDRHALPPATDNKGRLQVVTPKAVRETQGGFVDEVVAREFALAGTVAIPRADMPFVTRGEVVPRGTGGVDSRPGQPFVVGHPALVPGRPPGAVTLREATEADLFPTIAAARKASQRPGFPTPVGTDGPANLYDLSDLYVYRGRAA